MDSQANNHSEAIDDSAIALQKQFDRLIPGRQQTAVDPASERWISQASTGSSINRFISNAQQLHPEAGPRYWYARTWSVLSWQPAVLSLLCVHKLGKKFALNSFEQRETADGVHGYRFNNQPEFEDHPALIATQADQLNAYLSPITEQLQRSGNFKRALAEGLLADRILATLLRLQPLMGLTNTALKSFASQWLQSLQIEHASGLMSIAVTPSDEHLALDRKSCCQAFRCRDGSLCSTCPRIPRQDRINQLRQQWNQHV